MRFYIGLGGIGCRALRDYHLHHHDDADKTFYYIDTDAADASGANTYVIAAGGNSADAGMLRNIGRRMVQYELYTGAMAHFFSDIRMADKVDITFIVSSFGGFGGAAVAPLLDYLEAIAWEKLRSCTVLAFNEGTFEDAGFPDHVMQQFESNTIDFLSELAPREQDDLRQHRGPAYVFNPGCDLFLINTRYMQTADLWKYIEGPEELFVNLDVKDCYAIKTDAKKADVFISYSTVDQQTADRIADQLTEAGITPWLATRSLQSGSYAKQIIQGIREAKVFLVLLSKDSIASEQVKNEIDRAFNRLKDGMKIVPFVLDDSKLDDECEYYLCRQERFIGYIPPRDDRICELVRRIREII